MKVLLTGVTGFIGNELAQRLKSFVDTSSSQSVVSVAIRNLRKLPDYTEFLVSDITAETDWSDALVNQNLIIHTAARTHIMKDEVTDPLAEYRKVNVEGTLNLARQSAEAGVKRFIFISSIKVNGEQTPIGQPFGANDDPAPEDPYGVSKLEAEQGLQKLAVESGMEIVIIRPPLVYGPGVKGNFANMLKQVDKGLPLPLGAINNKRTLVALDNLVDLIITCIEHPAAANQVFLAGDGEDVSTTELLRAVAKAMGKPSRLVPVPAGLLMLGATLLGKRAVAERLLGSLQVDISKARDMLGWRPVVTMEEQLRKMFNS